MGTGGKHGSSPSAGRGRGVLVVEDDAEIRELIALELRPLAVDVAMVGSGEEALEFLSKGPPPDVLISDFQMQGMNGGELCARIRAEANLAATYVLMLTAHHDVGALQLLARGADDYLQKPYSAPDLRASVRAGLRAQAHRRVLARRERRRAIDWLSTVVAHEVNNPLTVALSALEFASQVLSEQANKEGDCKNEAYEEIDEALGDALGQLARIRDVSKRLNTSTMSLESGGREQMSLPELMAAIEVRLLPVCGAVTIRSERQSAGDGLFDRELILSATELVVRTAKAECDGDIEVAVHFNDARIAVLMEFSGAPERDPESILEPQLNSCDGAPATYNPGLSEVEAIFARHGGQIFARPVRSAKGNVWRFGLTLPMADGMAPSSRLAM